DQKGFIFAVFFTSNISIVNSILRRLRSYEGVTKVESFITTNVLYNVDWLRSDIDKRLTSSQKHLLSSTYAAAKDS
ncbi:MAG: hypothetical protein WAL24_12870, partial [Nitrososphaeraceae archaeon]